MKELLKGKCEKDTRIDKIMDRRMNAYDINDNLEKNQEDPNSYAFMYRRS
jgi:hypothetical protein